MIACEHKQTACVQILIDTKANIEHLDNEGKTPLMRAVGEGATEVVKILLKAKARDC